MTPYIRWYEYFNSQISELKELNHNYNNSTNTHDNPYHMEGSLFNHVRMVYQTTRVRKSGRVAEYCALLHDMGKLTTVEDDDEKQKRRFNNHWSASVQIALDFLMEEYTSGYITPLELYTILRVVNYHHIFWRQPQNKIFPKTASIFDELYEFSICDHLGRISEKTEEPTDKMEYIQPIKLRKYDNTKKNLHILIGLPASGKSTYAKTLKGTIISRDDIVMELGDGENYNECWDSVNQEEVNKELSKRWNTTKRGDNDVIIDMTNMSAKSRKRWISEINHDDFTITMHAFMLTTKQLYERRQNRDGKYIQSNVYNNMISSFELPYDNEYDRLLFYVDNELIYTEVK